MGQAHDPFEAFFEELAAYDAAYDEEWEEDLGIQIPPPTEEFVGKLLSNSALSISNRQLKRALKGKPKRFSQQQIVKACRRHPDLVVVCQKGYVLVDTADQSENLIYPGPKLKRKQVDLFVSEMWGQWLRVPKQGWEIQWEVDAVSDDECTLHPIIPGIFSLMEIDPGEDVYILHETITDALGLELLLVTV